MTLEFDPIEEAATNWRSAGWGAVDEMTEFVRDHLGPALERGGLGDLKILGYDQNRAGLDEWTASMYRDEESAKYFAGTAIHWYESTYEVFGDDLDRAHNMAPDKLLIETEALAAGPSVKPSLGVTSQVHSSPAAVAAEGTVEVM